LHDGAVIIRGDTIVGAGCILPLTQTRARRTLMGTRHRAALGLSEETDALVIVVSEETATVTVATSGRLVRDLSPAQVRDMVAGRIEGARLARRWDGHSIVTTRRASWLAAGVMFAVYVATLAPDVTFWDAGEFIAAARALGIPSSAGHAALHRCPEGLGQPCRPSFPLRSPRTFSRRHAVRLPSA
jgi:hypothetical protein